MPDALVTDTHAFLLHLTGDRKGMGAAALRAYDQADAGQAVIVVPVTALMEVLGAAERGRIRLEDGPVAWTTRLRAHPGFEVADLTADVVQRASEMPFLRQPADRLIAATALQHRAFLISGDPSFERAGVRTIW